jgi:predicted DsbA family dithiol-disulfide isomerase
MEIEIWSDFACPWCALGLYRLDVARAKFEHDDKISVRHRSFELDPRAPAKRPQTMEEVLAAKYGMDPEQVHRGHERLTALGSEVGMEFHFDRIQLGNTFDAHRLAQAARPAGVEDAVTKALFSAYFTEGKLLSDHGVLAQVAASAGLARDVIDPVLDSDAHADDVRADEQTAQEHGVTGVPYFLINGKWAVPGAQDVDTLLTVLRRAWERTEAAAS